MSEQRGNHSSPAPVERDGPTPASFSQARLWFADQMGRRGLEFVYPYAMRLSGPLDVTALGAALDTVVARHETLRTTFTATDGEPLQVVGDPFSLGLTVTPLTGGEEALLRVLKEAVELPFDLVRGPVLRARLWRTGPDEHVFLLVIHHIATDGWSMEIVFREIGAAYAAHTAGTVPDLPALPVQFADIAAWERERAAAGAFAEELKFWREALNGCPHVVGLPLDRPRPAAQTFEGGLLSFDLPAGTATAVEKLAKSCAASTYMVLLAAFDLLLARWSGQHDFVVGMPVANRDATATEDLVGFFTNLLPVRARVDLRRTFRELIAATREATLDAYDHQALSFDRLVEEIAPERTLAHNPLVQVAFNMEKEPAFAIDGVTAEPLDAQPDITRYDIAVDYFVKSGGGLRFDVYYASDLFERRTVEALAARFAFLVRTVVANPDTVLASLPGQSAADDAGVLELGQGALPGEADVPSLPDRFRSVAAERPGATAVVDGELSLTFAELDRRVEDIARSVAGAGAAAESVVGLLLPRSAELLAAILGVQRAGAAYLPLDPRYPAERLLHLVQDSGVSLVLAAEGADVPERIREAAAVRAVAESRDGDSAPPVVFASPHPDQTAYVIHTSGSTGRPKGVQVTHGSLARFLTGLEEAGAIRPGAGRVGWNASPSFDASVQQWARICRGDTVVILPEDVRRAPEELARVVSGQRLTDLDMTPSHAEHLLDHLAAALPAGTRLRIWTGGEQIPAPLWRRLAAHPTIDAVNVYGTTETTVDTTWTPVGPTGAPFLGTTLPGQSVRILDAALHPVPRGTPGELCIGGSSLARGYLGRPGPTAASFVPDPWGRDGARMYRTGDRARWSADGRLEFLGRDDQQVKVRGYRIELGEVESVLGEFPGLAECAVIRREQDGDAALAAYVHLTPAGTVQELRAHAEARLPEWMRPSAYTVLDVLPLTPSGKLDRHALTEPTAAVGTPAHDRDDAPRTATEELLIRISEEVLRVEGLRPLDNFFEAGGHSLLAIRVVARLKRNAQLTIPMTAVFENPVLRDLAAYVDDTIRARLASEGTR
ncbi:amino acid adenylation domain-containing protein [Streptomyces jumonjinensis]|uniref:amino acid adenylation domain-containing protein n=1 Tax=Streptomyces jumonjinensis TaxID=1945 RepID=UPI0037B16EDF